MRAPFDVGSIVPSMKDFLQAIATRRKRLALVPRVVESEELSRWIELGVAAIACDEPGATMREVAAGSLPILALEPVREDDDVLAARAYGADAVVIAVDAAADALGKKTRSTRMVPLFVVSDNADAKRAIDAGAKGVLVSGDSLDAIAKIVEALPQTTRVLAHLRNADAQSIRALVGRVDAAIVEHALASTDEFAALQAEVDPG